MVTSPRPPSCVPKVEDPHLLTGDLVINFVRVARERQLPEPGFIGCSRHLKPVKSEFENKAARLNMRLPATLVVAERVGALKARPISPSARRGQYPGTLRGFSPRAAASPRARGTNCRKAGCRTSVSEGAEKAIAIRGRPAAAWSPARLSSSR